MRNFSLSLLCMFAIFLTQGQTGMNCQHQKNAASANSLLTAPANLRSDTADVLKYTVSLNITDFTNNTIAGNTVVRFTPKINGLNYVCLDLLKMTIDSIKYNGTVMAYTYNDTLLRVDLASAYTTTDTLDMTVWYHGAPVMDPSGWGGWYWSSGYSFNLGVGFGSDPHVYGRVWHPCFDNFAERARYEFHITTSNGKVAYCNGLLIGDTTDVNALRTRSWQMNDEIPSYLASIAVASYTQVTQSYTYSGGQIPVVLTALPADTTNMKNSFIHLPDALTGYEEWYGPYVWDRIGYCLVPFSSGAMEHATNIAYPRVTANGTLTYEADLMAHEFSHHWWGDHLTCETQEEMWINEGMASYSEYLFRNFVYNWQTYIDAIKITHEDMVHHVHKREGWQTLNAIPHSLTYGDHVYRKGAIMAHTMRGYLGDSLFKVGLNYVQQQKSFKNMNSAEFGQLLTTATGVNMNQFMNDWIMNPGWPHFSIDSVSSVSAGGGNYTVSVYVRQRLFGAPNYYSNVPMEITFKNAAWTDEVKKIMVSGNLSVHTFTLSYNPSFTAINLESRIADAIASRYKTVKATGSVSFPTTQSSINVVSAGADSSFVRIEHNFVKPDSIKNNTNNYRLNDQHYWKVDGIFGNGFHTKGIFNFDGRKITSGNSYTDTLLTTQNADSMILLYRKNTADDWKEVNKYSKVKNGGVNGKYGYFTVDTLKTGEYATANGVSSVLIGIGNEEVFSEEFSVFPNPSNGSFVIAIKEQGLTQKSSYQLLDMNGKVVADGSITSGATSVAVNGIQSGLYFLRIWNGKRLMAAQRIVIEQ